MPIRNVNGINLSYEEFGSGDLLLLIPGTGARGTIWKAYQVPALVEAGFRVVTVDNRGVPPSDLCEAGFTIQDVVADTAALIESFDAGPCRIVGFSMGAMIVQETLLARPDLFDSAVLMATRGRADVTSAAISQAELELFDSGIKLPPQYGAIVRLMQGFSRSTLRDERTSRDWLDLFEMSLAGSSLSRSQLMLDVFPNRLPAYRRITTRCLIMAFEEDLLAPPHIGREVADSIAASTFQEIPSTGHFGYVEQPDAVNAAIIDFFRGAAG